MSTQLLRMFWSALDVSSRTSSCTHCLADSSRCRHSLPRHTAAHVRTHALNSDSTLTGGFALVACDAGPFAFDTCDPGPFVFSADSGRSVVAEAARA